MTKSKQQDLIDQLAAICEELEWVVGIPTEEGDENIAQGLIIGTETFVMSVVGMFPEPENVDVYSKEFIDDEMHQKEGESYDSTKKKKTFH